MQLEAQKRTIFGRQVKALRSEGLIPAELYGHGLENLHLSVSNKEFTKVFKEAGESTMIDLMVEKKKHPVMIHEVSYHPVTDDFISIDFYQVRLDEKIKINVPLNFLGEAPAVKEKNGVLVKGISEIEVEALPTDIPHDIEVDLTKLTDIGMNIHVKDLVISDKVQVLVDKGLAVISVGERMTKTEDEAQAEETDLSGISAETDKPKEEESEKKETEEDKS